MEGSDSDKRPEDADKCPECQGRIVREHDMGERYCEECGYVPDESMFAVGTGKHEYDGEGRPVHRPKPTYLRHDRGMSTRMGGRSGDYKDVRDKKTMKRLNRLNWQTMVEKDKSFKGGLEKLDMYGSKIGLPSSIREEAAYYLWEARGTLTRGRSYDEVIAGIYKVLCDSHCIPRSLDLISKKCECERKKVGRIVRLLKKKIDDFKHVRIPNPEDYLPWLCSDLNLSINVQTKAKEIVMMGSEHDVGVGRGPVGVAATATYIGSIIENERRTQREVADKADVTEVTIRNIARQYREKLGLEWES